MRTKVILATASLTLMGWVVLPSMAAANWSQKARHYCTHWGSAGLFPDDEKALASNPLAKLRIPLQSGKTLEFPLLYIFKGYELDESPKEWATVWRGFGQACPGWPKPQWAQKLETWKAQNRPKEDPSVAKRRQRIKSLLESADRAEARAMSERQRIMGSPAYAKITGGRDDWKTVAKAKQAVLQKVVSLKATRYIVIGKVVGDKLRQGAWVNGMAIAVKPSVSEPGTHLTPTRFFIQQPKASAFRANGGFLSDGLFLLGLPNSKNPNIVFGEALPAATKKAIADAGRDLRRVNATIRNGQARLQQLLKPVRKLEREAQDLRKLAQQLQGRGGKK